MAVTRLPLCAQCQSRHPYREHNAPRYVITVPPELSDKVVAEFKAAFRAAQARGTVMPVGRTIVRRIEAFSPVPQPIPERRWWRK